MSVQNLYIGLDDVKAAVEVTGTTYDTILTQMQQRACRLIDRAMGAAFYPTITTRDFDGNGRADLWLRPHFLLQPSAVLMSADQGYSYTDSLTLATHYWTMDGYSYDVTPFRMLRMNPNGGYGIWWGGRRAVRITGVWGWHSNFDDAFEDSQDALAADLNASAETCSVSDADGADAMGLTPRFQVGHLVQIGSEYCLITAVNTATNALTIKRARNGSTAAAHSSGDTVYTWRPEDIVQQATLMQTVRWFKRGQQAYQDSSAAFEIGKLLYMKKIDPEIELMMLEGGIREPAL